MDCACALVARGRRIADICRSIGVSRAQLSIRVHRQSDWQDRRQHSSFDDAAVLSRINTAVADLPTCGYRRVWALLRRESERDGQPVVNAKRVYRIMSTHHLLLELKPADNHRKRAHIGSGPIKDAWRWPRVTGAGAQMASSSAATIAKSCG